MGKHREFSQIRILLLALLALSVPMLFIHAHANETSPVKKPATKHAAPAVSITLPELAKEASERMMRVPEFEFIRQEAEKLGVKVYLFGGTAASYAHYVKEDMLRERGDTRYPADRFDYDYTNIFRSTQDLDVVIDGTGEQAAALEATLKRKFPHFVGDKAAQWEVRPLREARGDKEAILNNADFQNQHTDSHSTGLVEVTKPTPGESAVRDVRDWNAKEPIFLRDVSKSEIHYYFSPSHGETTRARKGLNPPILSAIRYLTKAFQYNLEIPAADLAKVREIVAAYDPKAPLDQYVKNWIEKNGKKLFLHSVNLEKSWNMLEELGLRRKLIAVKNNPGEVESLAWWMNKEPLRTQAVGQGSGKTAAAIAKERGVDKITLAHETNSFLAYESLTRSKAGDLNGLISRESAKGEAAVWGDGFYTRFGTSGARGTGLTIRMELAPDAREGTDFKLAGDYFILRNRAAVRVIPESIQLSLLEYFKQLGEGKSFSKDDRALLEAFRRKTKKSLTMDPAEKAAIFEYIERAVESPTRYEAVLEEWFKQPLSVERPDLLDRLLKAEGISGAAFRAFREPHWSDHPKVVEAVTDVMKKNTYATLVLPELLQIIAKSPTLQSHPDFLEWAKRAIKMTDHYMHLHETMDALVPVLYAKGQMEEFLEFVFKESKLADHLPRYAIHRILSKEPAGKLKRFGDLVDLALAQDPHEASKAILATQAAYEHPRFNQWLEKAGEGKDGLRSVAKVIGAVPLKYVKDPERWADRIVQAPMIPLEKLEAMSALLKGHQYFRDHPRANAWVDTLLRPQNIEDGKTFELVKYLSQWHPRKQTVARYIKLLDSGKDKKKLVGNLEQMLAVGQTGVPILTHSDYPLVDAYLRFTRREGNPYMNFFVHRITSEFRYHRLPAQLFDRWMSEALLEPGGFGTTAAIKEAFDWDEVKARPLYTKWVDKTLEISTNFDALLGSALRYPPKEPDRQKKYWGWLKKIAEGSPYPRAGSALLKHLDRTPGAHQHPEIVEAILLSKQYNFSDLADFFKTPLWRRQSAFQKMLRLGPGEDIYAHQLEQAIRSGKRLNPLASLVGTVKHKCSVWFDKLRHPN